MTISKNPLDKRGLTPSGDRWKLMPIVEKDLDVVYWDLRFCSGASKTESAPK